MDPPATFDGRIPGDLATGEGKFTFVVDAGTERRRACGNRQA